MARILLVLALGLLALATAEIYRGDKLYLVTPRNAEQVETLLKVQKEHKLDVFSDMRAGSSSQIHVKASQVAVVELAISATGADFQVVLHDVQEAVDAEKERIKSHPITDDISFFEDYRTLPEMEDRLNQRAADCGSRCELSVIGQSWLGKDLWLLKITADGGAAKERVWIDAGIHAREWISPAVAFWFIDRLIDDYGVDPVTTRILDAYDWYILVVMNPDGYEYSYEQERLWRTTRSVHPGYEDECPGCDANRNFDFMWSTIGFSDEPCDLTYSGIDAASEPEVQAVSNYIMQDEESYVFYVTMHSYSQLWMLPYGYSDEIPHNYENMLGAGNAAATALEAVHGKPYEVGRASEILYYSSGTSRDWAAGVPAIPYVYTIELRDRGFHGFELPPDQIIPSGEETWAGIQAMVEYHLDLPEQQ